MDVEVARFAATGQVPRQRPVAVLLFDAVEVLLLAADCVGVHQQPQGVALGQGPVERAVEEEAAVGQVGTRVAAGAVGRAHEMAGAAAGVEHLYREVALVAGLEADLGVVPSLQYKYLKLPDGSYFEISKPVNQKMFMELCDVLYLVDDETRRVWLDDLVATLRVTVDVDFYSVMTWDDIRSCIQQGFSICSHSYSHRNLSQVKEPEILETEIFYSRQRILEETGIAPSIFTFPNGLYNDSLLKMVKESGYSTALLCKERPANINIINDSDGVLCLPRIDSGMNWREAVLKSSGFHYHIKRITSFGESRDQRGHALRG